MKLIVTVNPNPFSSELFVQIQSDIGLNTVLRLTDQRENLIRMISFPLKKGENNIQVKNLSRYAIGAYKLEVKLLNGDLLESVKLLKE